MSSEPMRDARPVGPRSRRLSAQRRAALRLGLMAAAVIGAALAVSLGGVLSVDRQQLQTDLRGYGALAPLMFVALAGSMGALFVPAPFFAVLGSVLFGPVAGVPLGIAGAVLCALIGREIGARAGRTAAEELGGPRLESAAGWLDRYGVTAVVAMRLMPALPDALVNYASGLTRLHRWQVALGTAIGAFPRELGWGLVGAAIGGGSAWLGTSGGVLVVATDAVAALAVILLARRFGIGPRAAWEKLRGSAEPPAA